MDSGVLRAVWFHDDLDSGSMARLYEELLSFNDSSDPVNLFIDSFGGDVTQVVTYYEFVRALQFPIRAIAMHECESAAVDMFMFSGSERLTLPSTRFLLHAPQYCSESSESVPRLKSTLTRFEDYYSRVEELERAAVCGKLAVEDWARFRK